ncbi:MAG TPA: NAD(P)H-dependent oxidoreductase subunit E [Gemmatimonadota bacterium]|nr:NAD(P)H-dependent oxidoreductase subunit E [Gemmatimonadota bacterium]
MAEAGQTERNRFALTPEGERRVDEIIARYPERQAAMLPVLWVVQGEKGWIPPDAMEWVAQKLECTPATVQSVVRFYTMFDVRPVGKYKLQVCRTLSCELMGARRIIDHLRERLGVEPGQTTEDGLFTLQEVECLASCGTGPMLQCNLRFYENLTLERVDALLEELKGTDPDPDDVRPVIYERPDREAYARMAPEAVAAAGAGSSVKERV